MKRLNWVLCLAVAVAFVAGAGVASARTEQTTMVLRAVGFAIDPELECPAGTFGVKMTWLGLDDCGGASDCIMRACTPDGYACAAGTFDIAYRQGGTLSGTFGPFWQGQTGPRCMYTVVPPFHLELTGGTGEFDGAKGLGDGVMYTYSANCGGNSTVLGSIDLLVILPGSATCPNRPRPTRGPE